MMIDIFRESVDKDKYIIATYYLESNKTLKDAAWNLAIGQSVGNPNIRSSWETDELFENSSCIVLTLSDKKKLYGKGGIIDIAFPIANLDFKTDGISQLLCHLMGGQMDIDIVTKCHLLNLEFPDSVKEQFLYPKFGITGIRKYTKVNNKPILGGIVKPKVGITPEVLLEIVKEMVMGGINFIKEDEIMSNPNICPIEVRVPVIMDYLKDKNVIYAVCINSDPAYILKRVKLVHELGGNAVHINLWSGLGVYKSVRELDLPIFLFFQKSGDKVLTEKSHAYHIDWKVICQLSGMMGVDFIHAGMWGGYMSEDENELSKTLDILRTYNVMPSLSCGMHAGLIQTINKKFGVDYMANVGGAIHGHPGGTLSGVKALRQGIDGIHKKEYKQSIEKWGKLK
jgi:ribulose-bisphosphate carboxylase large chain